MPGLSLIAGYLDTLSGQLPRPVVEELADGSVVVDLHYAGETWLSREILKEAGDAVVLEPEDARRAVLEAAEALAGAAAAQR